MITTTLNRIREHNPCDDGWKKLLAGLGKNCSDDEPLPYARIVEINGIDNALWACRAEPQNSKEWRLFAVWCARESLKYARDWRSVAAVNVAERFAHGMACDDEMTAARAAASSAASSAALAAASSAASSAAWGAARAAARAAAASAASSAAWGAAWDAASSAARGAAWAAAWDAARDAARAAQAKKFLEIVG